jgi:hypothetical protein
LFIILHKNGCWVLKLAINHVVSLDSIVVRRGALDFVIYFTKCASDSVTHQSKDTKYMKGQNKDPASKNEPPLARMDL